MTAKDPMDAEGLATIQAGLSDFEDAFGYVYCAHGEKAVADCRISMATLLKRQPAGRVAVFTDTPEAFADFPKVEPKFLPPKFRQIRFDKFYTLCHAPFRKSLYIDSDTIIVNHMDCLSEALDRFEILATPDLFGAPHTDVPKYIPQINGGFLGFDKTRSGAVDFIEQWLHFYNENYQQNHRDQETLHKSFVEISARFHILPQEFNFMLVTPAVAKRQRHSVFMFHSRFIMDIIQAFGTRYIERLEEVADMESEVVWHKTKYGGYFDCKGRRRQLLDPGDRVRYRLNRIQGHLRRR